MKKFVQLAMIIVLLFPTLPFTRQASAEPLGAGDIRRVVSAQKIDASLLADLASMQVNQMTTVIVTLAAQANLAQITTEGQSARGKERVIRTLQTHAVRSQRNIRGLLETRLVQGSVRGFTPLWVINGLSITAKPEVIQELSNLSDVVSITPDDVDIIPVAPLAYAAPEPNLSKVNAPALWDLGFFGQGVVIASMDTGVDVNHPDLSANWRGGANSWYDPYGQHPDAPADLSGHGTWTMGVMTGLDSGGTSVGVAPQAQWIAVKIFNDQGGSTATAIHQGYQWLLDPDGNPATADQPHVVNNSWAFGAPGCNLEFQTDLQALRAVGILPVFAGGNYGPYGSTSVSPANYPEAFAVGATNNNDLSYGYSSRGPTSCGQPQSIYPKISAPGVRVQTTDLYGFYTTASGTSVAAPHVTGGLALLLSAFPDRTSVEMESVLTGAAVDLGYPGPDNTYGYGRLDLHAAYLSLFNSGTPSATPTTSANPEATLTAVASPTPSPTATASQSASATLSPTASPTPLPTATASPTPTATLPPTATASPTPTATLPPPASPTLPPTATASLTPTATLLPPASPTPSPTATASLTPTATLPPTATASPTPAATLPPAASPTPAPTLADSLFSDSFEQGDLSAWNPVMTGGGLLSASTASRLVGDWGMQAQINNTTPMFVADRSPIAETTYRARFYFSPNSVTIPRRAQHDLFVGLSATGVTLFRLQIRHSSGYQLRAVIRNSSNGEYATRWYALSNSSQSIEISWQAAGSPGSSDGSIELWLDGFLVEAVAGIANDNLRLEEVRLGPQTIGSGVFGAEFYDAFVSTRNTYIGP